MTAKEVAKWHEKSCIVTLKQGSVLVCDRCEFIEPSDLLRLWLSGYMNLFVIIREIKSIEARKP